MIAMKRFDQSELTVLGEYNFPGFFNFDDFVAPKWNTPITPRENMKRMLDGAGPLWTPNPIRDSNPILPLCFPDNYARTFGGTDAFGIEWVCESEKGSAMVAPGFKLFEDIADWREVVCPDLSSYDWQRDWEDNYAGRFYEDRFTYTILPNGIFERTADMIGFEDLFCALLTDPEELTEFWERLSDWCIDLIRIHRDVYHAEMVLFHDDMGTQISTFMAPDTYHELLTPHYKKICKAVHDMGMYAARHCCGCVGTLVPYFIEEGWDIWEGQDSANDKVALMDQYGKDLAHLTLHIVPADMPDDEAVQLVHHIVDDLAYSGRYAARLMDGKADRAIDLSEELYRYSRIKYCG